MNHRFLAQCMLAGFILIAAGCSKTDTSQQVDAQSASVPLAEKTTLLATIGDDEKPQSVTPAMGMGAHASLEATFKPVFSQRGGGVAYCAENKGKVYVVHNGKPGKSYTNVGAIAISPDGSRIAYGALDGGKWRMVIDSKEGESFSALKAPVFSPDGVHVAYQAMSGVKWHLVVDAKANAGTDTRILDHAFSGDSARIAYIDNADDKNAGRLVISDLTFSQQTVVAHKVSRMIINEHGTRIAAIRAIDNGSGIIECGFDRAGTVKTTSPYDRIQQMAFGIDGDSLVYVAERLGKRYLVYGGTEQPLPAGGEVNEPPVASSKGAKALVAANNAMFMVANGSTNKAYEEAANLVTGRDGTQHAYAARRGNSWFVVVNDQEGPAFDRVVNPLFSPDGKYVVYRARKEGKRFVVLADTNARTIKTYPEYEQVFEVKFLRDGKSFAYGVKDGQKLIWKVDAL